MGSTTEGATVVNTQDDPRAREIFAAEKAYYEAHFHAQEEARRRALDARPPEQNYNTDLWSLTAPAATNESHVQHPVIPNATSGQLHASEGLELMDRGWAARENEEALKQFVKNPDNDPRKFIPPNHEHAPAFAYNPDLAPPPEGLPGSDTRDPSGIQRLYREYEENGIPKDNLHGPYVTPSSNINDGNIRASEGQALLSLPNPPTHVADAYIPVGTSSIASRPISGQTWQIKIVSGLDAVQWANKHALKPG